MILRASLASWVEVGYCPHTVTVYNRATIKVLIYLYYEYYSTVAECGQYPAQRLPCSQSPLLSASA